MKTRKPSRSSRSQARRSFFGSPWNTPARALNRRPLRVEQLEDRRVLATYNWDSTANTLSITLAANEDLTISEAAGTVSFGIDSGTFTNGGPNAATGDGTATITILNTDLETSIAVNNTAAGAGTNNVTFAGGTIGTDSLTVNNNAAGTTSAINFTTAPTLFGNTGGGSDTVSLTANGGTITQTAAIDTDTFDAQLTLSAAGQAIDLSNANNDFDFSAEVIVTAAASLILDDTDDIEIGPINVTNNVDLDTGGEIDFIGASTIGGNLTVETDVNGGSGGQIENLAGSLSVTGTTTLDAGNQDVELDSATNDFGGAVTITQADLGVDIDDDDDITFGAVTTIGSFNVDAGGAVTFTGVVTVGANLDVDSSENGASGGAITDSGAGQLLITGTTTLDAGDQNVALDNPANNFGGAVSVSQANGGIVIDDVGAISFAAVTTTGSFDVDAAGAVTFTGLVTVGVNLDVDTNANGGAGGAITDTGAGQLNITGATTLDSGNQVITLNDSANQLGTSITTTSTANQTLVDTNGFTAVNVNAGAAAVVDMTVGGAITDGDNDIDITAADLILRVTGGIGTGIAPGAAIQTDVDRLDVSNLTAGNIFILNTGALTLQNLSATPNAFAVFDNTAGAGNIRASSPLTFASDMQTTGGFTYDATDDNVAPTDDITINNGVTVSDTSGSLIFNAGDDFLLQVNAEIEVVAGQIVTINADTPPVPGADADAGDGSLILLEGDITATSGVFITSGADDDEYRIRTTTAGTPYNINTAGGNDTVIVGSLAPSTTTGDLDNIQGNINLTTGAGTDSLSVIDIDAAAGDGFTLSAVGTTTRLRFNSDAFATPPVFPLTYTTPVDIVYDATGGAGQLETFLLRTSNAGADAIDVQVTTATQTTTIESNGGTDTFNINASALGGTLNTMRGGANDDAFRVNITTGAAISAPLDIEGNANDFGGGVGSRDVVSVTDTIGLGVVNATITYTGGVGGSEVTVAGLNSLLTVDTAETIDYNGAGGLNDQITVVGTATGDDLITAAPIGANRALVFNNAPTDASGPFNGPPEDFATRIPGVSGGSTRPDLDLSGIANATGLTITDPGPGTGDRLYVYGQDEAGLNDGNTFDPFGFGAGQILPATAFPNANDVINVDDDSVQVDALAIVNFNDTDFIQADPLVDPSVVVNAGNEQNPTTPPPDADSDLIDVTLSTTYKFQINGNDPDPDTTGVVPPAGDQLNVNGTADVVNVWATKDAGGGPPVVTIDFDFANSGILPISFSSIEELGAISATTVNLIGDNNDPTVDQNDTFIVVGADVDSDPTDGGYQEFLLYINNLVVPIPFDDVQFLNVFGFDQQSGGADNPVGGPLENIDTLELTPYADNAGNPPNNAPRGWGIDVFFNEGVPAGQDGLQDLLIYHTSLGLGGGGSVSEDIVVQPSGPDNGEVRVTNAADGSVIVVVQYVANTDIIVVDDDGSLSDTDTLTLRGTNPDTVQTSGNDSFVVDFDAAGDVANPYVTVTDSETGAILYRLRSFTDPGGAPGPFATVTFDMLAGNDSLLFRTPDGAVGLNPQFSSGVEQVNVLGGLGDDSVTVDYGDNDRHIWHNGRLFVDGGAGGGDSLTITGDAAPDNITTVNYTPGPLPGNGRIEHADGTDPAQVIDFVNLEPVVDYTAAGALVVNANNANNAISYFSDNGVATYDSLAGGAGYANGVYLNVPLTGGTGTGATANITVVGNVVVDVVIVNDGSGYTLGDDLSADDADLGGGGGAGFSINVISLSATVAIDDHETIAFTNKATLVLNALGGDDAVSLNNPFAPAGLGVGVAAGSPVITVNGGDPTTVGDKVIINGTVDADPIAAGIQGDVIAYTPTAADSGFYTGVQGVARVNVNTTEVHLLNGLGGPDTLTINGTAVDDTFTINPANGGTGSHASNAAPIFNYVNVPTVTVDDDAGGFDLVVVNGTAGPDAFTAAAAALTLAGGGTVNFGDGIQRLDLNLLAGNDVATLTLLTAITPPVTTPASPATIVYAGIGDDAVVGSGLVDLIYGGEGNDVLIGGDGNDILFGEAGNDRFGDPAIAAPGTANDPGADQFHGGDGSDTFVWDPGDGSDVIEGGDGISDVLIFNGAGGVDNFSLTAVGARLSAFRTQGAITLDTADVEVVNLNGLGGLDTFVVNDLYPTAVEVVNIDFGAADGVADAVTINGRDVSDNVNISDIAGVVEVTGLRYDVNVANATGADQDAFTFNANGGNDVVVTGDNLSARFLSTNVAGTNRFTLDGGAGDDFLTSYGRLIGGLGNDTLIGSTTLAGVNANQLIEGGNANPPNDTVGDGNDTIRGGAGIDFIFGDRGEDTILADFDSATDTINGGADFDTILLQTTSGNDRIDFLQTLATQIQFNVAGLPAGATGIVGGAGTQIDTLVAQTVEEFKILAGSGDDTIRVAHDHQLIEDGVEEDVLRITVDGGAPGASDRLSVTDLGPGNTTVHRVGGTAGEGSFQMYAFDAGGDVIGMPPVVYTDIEFASLNPINPITGGTGDPPREGRLFVFKYDPHEENNSRLNATHLGANDAINVDPVIDPGADQDFNLPGDEDWYRVVAETTGTLDFTIYFRQQGDLANGQAGLPGEGDLQLQAFDADGEPIPGFGTNESASDDEDERIRIPVVAGQSYYFRVSGTSRNAINVYNVTVLNEAPPVPYDLELDDQIVQGTVTLGDAVAPFTVFRGNAALSPINDFYNGKVVSFTFDTPTLGLRGEEAVVLDYNGATREFTLATTLSSAIAVNDTFQIESVDTGRNSTDNTTRDNTPRLFFRLDDAIFLHDLPGNPVDDSPPDQVIAIPFNPSQTQDGLDLAGQGPGFRIAIFDEGQPTQPGQLPQQPIGYARQVAEGVYVFDFGIDAINPLAPNGASTSFTLADGSHFLSARVQIIDPNTNFDTVLDDVVAPIDLTTLGVQSPKGFGDRSASLEIIVDTDPPPVSFGDPGLDGDGLTPDSDSFVIPNPHTIGDLVTNDLTPTFWGRGEADATIRLFVDSYVDVNGNGVFDGGDIAPNGVFDPNLDVFIGQFTSIPIDGNQQEPNGFWQIESVVNFNDPRFFATPDGSRLVFVTAEDVAGNVNDNTDPAELEIFIDTQGPQVTGVTINQPDLFALAPGNVLLTVNSSNPTLITSTTTVTGLGGRTLQAIDVLPAAFGGFAAGSLFGLATNGANAQVFFINPDNGAATPASPTFGNPAATGWGFDFDPTSLLLRVTNNLDQNFSVNVDTNAVAADAALNAAGTEDIVGSAYDRNDTDPASPTTLFGIDFVTDFLVRQGDVNGAPATPAGGVITPIGALGVNADAQTGFDIAPGSNVAFASINDSLYTINLATGVATLVGKIGAPAQQILGIAVADAYDLFDPKPSTDGPTPLVNSLIISFQDLPERTAAFLEEALKLDVADTPGLYQVRGDYNGIIPILAINVVNQPVIAGEPAFATVELVFRQAGLDNIFNTADDIGKPLPDDRFTLTVLDNVQDLAGNLLDGEHNAIEPQETLVFPTGDGIPGGNFVARFTVDSRPEVGVWATGSAWIDTNGNTSFDPTNADFTNRDITYVLGFASDHLFAGKFMTPNDPNSPNARFDRLGAYGRVGTTTYRWLIDTDNDGVPDREVFDPANINGIPVAGNFNLGFAGDEVSVFAGDRWHFDAIGNDLRVDTQLAWPEPGVPIVGDFDGDGLDDLATWRDDTFFVDLSSTRPGGSPVGPLAGNGNINGRIDREFRFGFIGIGEKPVAADMNMDGIEDLGLWVPARDGVPPTEGAEWYFLISGAVQNDTSPFNPGVHGPSITGGVYPSNGHVGPGAHLAVGNYAAQGLVLDSYTNGRIVDDPLVAGVNDIVRFNPTPFGNDQYFQFGDAYALPIVGNFDPPVAGSPGLGGTGTNPRDVFDVDNNGFITAADALVIIDHLNAFGSTEVPTSGFIGTPFMDLDGNGVITAADALIVIDRLNLLGEGEGEAADAYFSELDNQGEGEENDLLAVLAEDQNG